MSPHGMGYARASHTIDGIKTYQRHVTEMKRAPTSFDRSENVP